MRDLDRELSLSGRNGSLPDHMLIVEQSSIALSA